VKVPSDESVTDRSEVKPEGKPGKGSPKPDGVRMRAVSLSPEKGIVAEECKNCIFARGSREMRRCRNTVSALRDSRKTVSGGKLFDLLKLQGRKLFIFILRG
jgi:hypothetical protein